MYRIFTEPFIQLVFTVSQDNNAIYINPCDVLYTVIKNAVCIYYLVGPETSAIN